MVFSAFRTGMIKLTRILLMLTCESGFLDQLKFNKLFEKIFDILRSLSRNGLTIVMITHNPDLAARANRTVHIKDGLVHTKN